jgi:HD superfamily phosphohydrolase
MHAFDAKGSGRALRKGVSQLREEENALYIAILLHDIGTGPFSHAMEKSIVEDVHHEEISLLFMHQLNVEFNGQLNLAIQVFEGDYIENLCCSLFQPIR